MKHLGWLLTFSAVALAQQSVGGGGMRGPASTPGALLQAAYATPGTGLQSYYVDPTGNDSNACTASGGSACLTIQGALRKVPKILRDQVTINIAAGTYACFYVQGFTCDYGFNAGATGGLLIDGLAAFTASSLASGGNVGKFAAGSKGVDVTYGTATDRVDAGAGWTDGDLRNRFLKITSGTGSGQQRLIESNDSGVLTIGSVWATAPDSTSAYAIQDPGVIINTACSISNPLSGVTSNNAAVMVSDNLCGARGSSIVLRGLRLTGSGGGLFYSDTSGGLISLSQVRNTGSGSEGIAVGQSTAGSRLTGIGRLDVTDVEVDAPSTADGIRTFGGLMSITRALVHDGFGGVTAINLGEMSVNTLDGQQLSNPARAAQGGRISAMSSTHLDCHNAGDVAMNVSSVIGGNALQGPAQFNATTVQVSVCGYGASISGNGAQFDVSALSGTAAVTGIDVQLGGLALYTRDGGSLTSGVNDLNCDNGDATGTFASVIAGTCLVSSTSGNYSRACAR